MNDERQITHFVGDDCPPDGHRSEWAKEVDDNLHSTHSEEDS